MPSIRVVIEWDHPNDPLWLNADNVALALEAHCQSTRFKVVPILQVNPCPFKEVRDNETAITSSGHGMSA